MKIRLAADLQPDSIVDGIGIRTVLWTQGCPHHCKGCHNPITHSFDDGFLVDVEDIKQQVKKLKNQKGLTFSGGDPMCQAKQCAEIAKYAKSLGMDIWCYTGYTFEQLLSMNNKDILEFLNYIDILVDGKFVLEEKSYNLKFKGSKNQRIIDVSRSLIEDKIVLLEEEKEPTKKEYIFI